MADFEEIREEGAELSSIYQQLFSYILLKYTVNDLQNLDFQISDMRCFLQDKHSDTVQPSQIHYAELINENPDSDDTMCIIAEDLIESLTTKNKMDG